MSVITHETVARTLAAYALSMLYGYKLQPFEEEHVVALALWAGVQVGEGHLLRRAEVEALEKAAAAETDRLRRLVMERVRPPWWKIWGVRK
jgi:hypothetical protein